MRIRSRVVTRKMLKHMNVKEPAYQSQCLLINADDDDDPEEIEDDPEEKEAPVRVLDEDDIALLKTYGLGPYATSIKNVEKDIKETQKKVNDLLGAPPPPAGPGAAGATRT